jgi:hypothetical protein
VQFQLRYDILRFGGKKKEKAIGSLNIFSVNSISVAKLHLKYI